MKNSPLLRSLVFFVLVSLLSFSGNGCQQDKPAPTKSQDSPEAKSADQKLIDAQGICPVSGDKLGSMGAPIKVMLKDQPVFLCCKSCKAEALKDPEKTLAKLEKLKNKNKE